MSAATRPLPSPFVACFLYAIRVCVPPKRWALLALPAIGSVLFGLLANLVDNPTPESRFNVVTLGLFGLVLPFSSLVVGDAVLGSERRSGALALTWLSPTPYATIVLARFLAGWFLAAVATVPGMALAAVVAGVPDTVAPLALGVTAGCAGYTAVFMFFGATFQRGSVLWSLGFLFLAERLLGTVLAGVAQLSPLWLSWNVWAGLGPGADERLYDGIPAGWGAVVRLVIITGVLLALTTRRLRRIKLAGAAE